MQDYSTLSFDQLKTLHQDIGALIAQRRAETLEQIKQQISALGFNADDLVQSKKRTPRLAPVRYRNPEQPENTWSGRGKRPQWLQAKLAEGRSLDEFAAD